MAKNAICIGINNYPGTRMDLQGCVNDAQEWAETLGARGYNVKSLLDEQATKSAMVQGLSDLIANSKEGDNLIITFSGHGTYQPDSSGDESDGLDEALCPYDIHTNGNALTDDEIRDLFNRREEGVSVLLISDSCHSGTVSRAAQTDAGAEEPRPRFMPTGNWLSEGKLKSTTLDSLIAKLEQSGVLDVPFHSTLNEQQDDLLMSGCEEGANNFSYDAKIQGRYNGAFTYYALKTLKQMQPDATYVDWHKAISRYLPSSSYPQSPQILGNESALSRKIFS